MPRLMLMLMPILMMIMVTMTTTFMICDGDGDDFSFGYLPCPDTSTLPSYTAPHPLPKTVTTLLAFPHVVLFLKG